MVDNINFPKGLSPVPASGRVQRVNRKKREQEKPPFEKLLNPEDQEEKKKKKKKKNSDADGILGQNETRQAQNSTQPSSSSGSEEADEDSIKKIIDVRV